MSRIGRQQINIPAEVEVKIDDGKIICKGPKGTLDFVFDKRVKIEIKDKLINLSIPTESNSIELSAIWGTTRALINNMIKGVKEGFEKKLEINGVGYNAQSAGKKLTLNLGFSHPVEVEIPGNIEVKVEKNVITIAGINKQEVGQFAARIREYKKPEPYKGKGIKYIDEHIRKKAGKKVVGSEGGGE